MEVKDYVHDPSFNLNRLVSIPSQMLLVSFNGTPVRITLDSGATVSYIKASIVTDLQLKVSPNNQLALLADKKTRMASLGEIDCLVSLGDIQLRLRALVMQNLQADCFGGTTFHADNGIEARIKEGIVKIHGKYVVNQCNPCCDMPVHPPPSETLSSPDVPTALPASKNSPCSSLKLNAVSLPVDAVIYPSDFLSIPLKHNYHLPYVSITPSFPNAYDNPNWTPQICQVINGAAMYKNVSTTPLSVQKYAHFRPHSVTISELQDVTPNPITQETVKLSSVVTVNKPVKDLAHRLSMIKINRTVMSADQSQRLDAINNAYSNVFDDDLTGGYNHHAGKFHADFSFSNKPPPTRVFVPQYNKKCMDLQQAKCDELESQGVLMDPKACNVPIFHVSPSWIQQKGRAKHKNLQDCTLDELRFITAFNTLNDHIRPKPTMSCSANQIFKFLARWKFHVFADLNNSYFQIPVNKKLWSYLGIMTPYKGVRVLTRAGQGLLGSDVELEELLKRVLGEEISAGFCVSIRDDIVIGGNTVSEAIENYSSVLEKFSLNNLKLSPSKIRLFPQDTEIYGYRLKNGCVMPSDHTVTSLGQAKIEELITNKQVNSWKGLFKTLIGHLPALSSIIAPFDSATAGKDSREKFVWTPALTTAFNQAMKHLKHINATYLPKPNEQLILLPDAMSTSPCVGWVLYVRRDGKLYPVSYCTAKLKDYMVNWYSCEQEAVGVVLSLDQCSHWIRESKHPTLIGPDSLAVVKAVDLIRRGKHSSNPRLQSLLSSINRLNVIFFHNSAKAGRHIVPDHLSRLRDTTCKSADCAIERFLHDIPINVEAMSTNLLNSSSTLLALCLENDIPAPTVITATSTDLANQLLQAGPIPLGSRQTWIQMQKSDQDCQMVYKLISLGEEPRRKGSNPIINKIFKEATVNRGLLIVKAFDSRKMREIEKVVVPPSFLDSILSVLHIRLNHRKKHN